MISGSYTVDITMGAAFTQPEKVQAVIGKHGENLRGPFIVTLDESGKYAPLKFPQSAESSEAEPFIHYTQRIVVAGEPSFDIAAKAAASRPAASPAQKTLQPASNWKRFEADNGAVFALDLGTVDRRNACSGCRCRDDLIVDNDVCNILDQRQILFDCRGHYMEVLSHSGPQIAPPYSVIGRMAAAACVGARAD
jgi:hypothetical protein